MTDGEIIQFPTHYSAKIDMPTAFAASVVAQAIAVDPELRPDCVKRHIYATGDVINIEVEAKDVKSLRTAVTSLYDFIKISIMAVAQFPQ